MKEGEEKLLQTDIPRTARDFFKSHSRDLGVKLKVLQEKMVQDLIDTCGKEDIAWLEPAKVARTAEHKRKQAVFPDLFPGVYVNIVFSNSFVSAIKAKAEDEGVSVRVFLHTAFMRYYEKMQLKGLAE